MPLPGGLDASRPPRSVSAGWPPRPRSRGREGALRPGKSVLVLGANGQVGWIAVQAARLLGVRRVTGVVQHQAAREAPLRLGAGTMVTSQDLPPLTERTLNRTSEAMTSRPRWSARR